MIKRHWHPASKFPTPGIKLLVETRQGTQIKAIRPHYVKSYNADPEFKTLDTNQPISEVKQWAIL